MGASFDMLLVDSLSFFLVYQSLVNLRDRLPNLGDFLVDSFILVDSLV